MVVFSKRKQDEKTLNTWNNHDYFRSKLPKIYDSSRDRNLKDW